VDKRFSIPSGRREEEDEDCNIWKDGRKSFVITTSHSPLTATKKNN